MFQREKGLRFSIWLANICCLKGLDFYHVYPLLAGISTLLSFVTYPLFKSGFFLFHFIFFLFCCLEELTRKSRHKKTVSHRKLICLPSAADYSSLMLLELIPGLEVRVRVRPDTPPRPAANHRAAGPSSVQMRWLSTANFGLEMAQQTAVLQPLTQDHPREICFLSPVPLDRLDPGAAARISDPADG